MPLRRPPTGGSIRRSQYGGPALELRETLAAKLAAIAQRGAQVEPPEPPESPSDTDVGGEDSDLEPEGLESSSDDEADGEDDESVASSSGASSLETSPVPSPTVPAPTSALPSTTVPASIQLSSTLSTALGPAPTSTFAPTGREEDSDSDEDPVESILNSLSPKPTSASATAAAELSPDPSFPTGTSSADGAQQSGEVLVMSGPPPRPPRSGISQSTEHLLIAAGSIGATLLIVMVIWGVYTMRKKGLTFRDLVQMSRRSRGRPDRTADIAKPSIHRMPSYASDDKERYSLPQPPQNSLLRFDSVSSQGPGGQRDYLGPFLGRQPSTPKASNRSFLEETTPPQGLSRATSNAHSRNSSSPTLLPLQTQVPRQSSSYSDSPPSLPIQRSASYKGSQAPSRYSSERNDIVSPEAPGPTYQNFTASRRFTTNRGPNYESHFSWTQSSQAPPTPIEPTTPAENGRISIATTASSVARFRTVDSWVGNQAGRIPSTQLRNQPHWSYRQSTSTNGGLGQVDEGQPGWQQEYNAANDVPEVPSVPSRFKPQPPAPQHQRHPTSYSDATVFRQHPGTEVQIPRGSLVPSEVLDAHMIPSAL